MAREPPPGLQAERTVLAWNRTALASVALDALLVLHATTRAGTSLKILLFAFAGASVFSVAVLLLTRRRALAVAEPTSLSRWSARALVAVIAGAAAVSLAAVVLD